MMRRNLEDCLEMMNENTMVSIGSNFGTGYIYVGPAGDVDAIENAFNECLRKAKSNQEAAISCIFDMLSEPLEKKGEDYVLDDILSRADVITKRLDRYKRETNYIDTFRPVMERDVIDMYHNIENETMVIIVYGIEKI